MLRFFASVFLFLFSLISYHPVSATAEAKILNNEEQIALLDEWKAPKEILEKFPYYVSGFDIEKRPVFIFEIGKWPIRSYVEKGGKDLENLRTHMKQFFRRIELGPRAFFNESEMVAPDTVVIMDWEGFGLRQLVHKPTVKEILHQFATFQKIQDSFAYGFYLNVNTFATHFISLGNQFWGVHSNG
ncbi:unnamed protein product [Allacma fusca]|uniref:Uncharacterized protein n=1 Tax=Allacma fusca TaxID=39272 RepID=A0A8J2Q2B7_9HEXA|nr:unnamed protein product [Allacma fusca]